MHDTVIRGATVVDGSGRDRFTADIAIDDGLVCEVGRVGGRGREEIAADGLLATPGWVDIHTHYDGQVSWDPLLTPSFWHGVTTVVMGNCGVGFAPVAPERRDWLIGLMEGVEDIPGTALSEGIDWEWESFPQYLDAIDAKPHAIDFGAQIAHGAVRAYVMGERGARNEAANPEDIQAMAALVQESLEAGALGFSTSRTLVHIAVDGEPVPGTFAAEDELRAFAEVIGRLGHGILEVAPAGVAGEDASAPAKEMAWMRKLSSQTGCPITFLLGQTNDDPEAWRNMLALVDEASRDGARVYPQVFGRPTNILFTFAGLCPFSRYPSFLPLMEMDADQRLVHLRDPQFKARILAEEDPNQDVFSMILADPWDKVFVLGDPVDYEPDPQNSVATLARARGLTPKELAYDSMLDEDGNGMLYWALLGYCDGNLDPQREMLVHPSSVLGAGDGGAHCRAICDAGVPTFMLSHWARDRHRGRKLPLEWLGKKQTSDTARPFGMHDRGLIAAGMKADINLIDFDRLRPGRPELVNDLPANAARLMQKAQGYVRTIVSGQTVAEQGEETGRRPGRLVRGGGGRPGAH